MRELNQEEQKILSDGVIDIQKRYTQGLLPEEEKLLDEQFKRDESPSPGYHIHSEENPTGIHRHTSKDSIDGEHRHTVMNPGGEHVHGLFEGQALIDGSHTHGGSYDLGWHRHESKEGKNDGTGIIPEQKPSIL